MDIARFFELQSVVVRAVNEGQIKARVLTELRALKRISKRSIIANEFALSKSLVRADLAILESKFIGIEVKSEKDTLRRLPSQIASYLRHFDWVILVVASKHAYKVIELNLLFVELWVMHADGSIEIIQTPKSASPQAGICIGRLLTQADQKRYIGCEGNYHTNNQDYFDINKSNAHAAFINVFSSRFGKTSKEFWDAVRYRQIKSDDLAKLSRFQSSREQFARVKEEQDHMWRMWAEQFHSSTLSTI
ncbi:sce7726 family protein [Acidisoma silvae]|uniref:Sce7726 family protein n=1 Tax=Acidisoma silvae TaxID=2802396 RepID=A0A963YVK9_9PROT|nr:sce7726 family protein [Acidisoma silvae]MCB8877661.1 sce7726 family protein [Acidisoma silvae]